MIKPAWTRLLKTSLNFDHWYWGGETGLEVVQRKVVPLYSGDLNNEHLNNKKIWITNFHLFGIQMYSDHHPNTSPVFKWWSEYRTKSSPVFKWHSNNGPFDNRTTFDHLNTRLVRYSDPHCNHNLILDPLVSETCCGVFFCKQVIKIIWIPDYWNVLKLSDCRILFKCFTSIRMIAFLNPDTGFM